MFTPCALPDIRVNFNFDQPRRSIGVQAHTLKEAMNNGFIKMIAFCTGSQALARASSGQ